MERSRRRASGEPSRIFRPNSPERVVASRRAAMEALDSAILGDEGPAGVVLLTGESGAGKSWLWRRLADQAPADRRFAVVEAAPGLEPVDFLNLAADALGLDPADRLGTIRVALARALGDESADGRSWTLVVENAHHASPAVWGEIEALCGDDRSERGFAAVILVGRTELARRFAARPSATMAARVDRHLHLPPLDADEAAQLAEAADLDLDPAELDRLHRDAGGNPRRLLRLIANQRTRPQARGAVARPPAPVRLADQRPRPRAEIEVEPAAPAAEIKVETDDRLLAPPPPLVPSRPPIREEEGLIEVGWAGGPDDEAVEGEVADIAEPAPLVDEAVDDHYAALQAWTEWARNRDRTVPEAVADIEVEVGVEEATDDEPEADDEVEAREAGAEHRGEPPHDHAPYGQLFTRLRQSS